MSNKNEKLNYYFRDPIAKRNIIITSVATCFFIKLPTFLLKLFLCISYDDFILPLAVLASLIESGLLPSLIYDVNLYVLILMVLKFPFIYLCLYLIVLKLLWFITAEKLRIIYLTVDLPLQFEEDVEHGSKDQDILLLTLTFLICFDFVMSVSAILSIIIVDIYFFI